MKGRATKELVATSCSNVQIPTCGFQGGINTLVQLGSIETVDFNNRLIETVDFNRFNKFQYRELTTEKLSKSVIVKNVKHGRHRFSFFFAQNGFLT